MGEKSLQTSSMFNKSSLPLYASLDGVAVQRVTVIFYTLPSTSKNSFFPPTKLSERFLDSALLFLGFSVFNCN